MFTRLRLILVLAVIGIVAGVAFTTASGDAQAQPTQFQSGNMEVFGDPGNLVPGAANLTRTDQGISFRIYTTELTPGHAYTVWIAIFNRPENCAGGVGGCGSPDLDTPDVMGSVVYGTSYIAGDNGNGNFYGGLDKGAPPAGIQVNVPAGTANGLIDPMKAEIHLVVRTHGMPVEGHAAQQLSTFEDGCAACANVQSVAFLPPSMPDEDDEDEDGD